MSMNTSYRYEIMTGNSSLQNALQRQQERIKLDEIMAEREYQQKLERGISLKSNWTESLDAVAEQKKIKNQITQTQSELKFAQKSTIMVRRAALRQLLEQEYKLYEKELHNSGKSFYIKRT